MVEERNKEVISEYNPLREQMCKYENGKAEKEIAPYLSQFDKHFLFKMKIKVILIKIKEDLNFQPADDTTFH